MHRNRRNERRRAARWLVRLARLRDPPARWPAWSEAAPLPPASEWRGYNRRVPPTLFPTLVFLSRYRDARREGAVCSWPVRREPGARRRPTALDPRAADPARPGFPPPGDGPGRRSAGAHRGKRAVENPPDRICRAFDRCLLA